VTTPSPTVSSGLRVLVLSWRDSGHPEGGGAELYLDNVLAGLVRAGHVITVLTARYPGSARRSDEGGVRILRAGGRFTVYLRTAQRMLLRRGGRFDVVVDVQNGMPFFARLLTRRPVVVLCHHVHREQWSIALGTGWGGRFAARVGWWVESWLAPRAFRRCRYITVSGRSADDLVALGVDSDRVTVVHNGAPPPRTGTARAAQPELLVLGRLVPHKQVEHAVRSLAALSDRFPGLRLTVAGHGWWEQEIRDEVARLGLGSRVELTGFVDEDQKHVLLSRAWVLVTPSVKEGWGLCVIEAAAHGTPTVAYRSAGGVAESVLHGSTGLLAEDEADLTSQIALLLADAELRTAMGASATAHARGFTWTRTAALFEDVLVTAAGRRPADVPRHVVAIPSPSTPGDDLVLLDAEAVGS
jgi:glycosyltransferase involved in cell wall biosynthesis